MPIQDFNVCKLGGPGKSVQIDETMLNYKCKSYRGRSPGNRTDALVIAEIMDNKVTRIYAKVISDKLATTMLPIICNQVVPGSVVHTDEHRSYSRLSANGYIHGTVCHKYNFVDRVTGVHTQAVESINNLIKICIKNKQGVLTEEREEFIV